MHAGEVLAHLRWRDAFHAAEVRHQLRLWIGHAVRHENRIHVTAERYDARVHRDGERYLLLDEEVAAQAFAFAQADPSHALATRASQRLQNGDGVVVAILRVREATVPQETRRAVIGDDGVTIQLGRQNAVLDEKMFPEQLRREACPLPLAAATRIHVHEDAH